MLELVCDDNISNLFIQVSKFLCGLCDNNIIANIHTYNMLRLIEFSMTAAMPVLAQECLNIMDSAFQAILPCLL